MTVEELLDELRQLPLTVYVAVKTNERSKGVSVERVRYGGGEALIYLETDNAWDDAWDRNRA